MNKISIHKARVEDFDSILTLNELEVTQTSELDRERLIELDAIASFHSVINVDSHFAGFLLAMGHEDLYINDNFSWFRNHCSRFGYIDRIVIASEFKGQGLGKRLYLELFDWARARNIGQVCCEYNVVPMNGASRDFHSKMGFYEVGQRAIPDSSKTVSMQMKELN